MKWLNCKISEGQFTDEFAVQGKTFNSLKFSLFASKDCIKCKVPPKPGKVVEGSICVKILDKKDDLVLVELPQPTFENGQAITVKAEQIISD